MSSVSTLQNLDQLLLSEGFLKRLECSMTMHEMRTSAGVEAKQYQRPGLGVWEISMISVENLPSMIVGAPSEIEGAGCSIWYPDNVLLSDAIVAAVFVSVFDDLEIDFINPDTGQVVMPDLDGLASSKERPAVSVRPPRSRLASQPSSSLGSGGLYEHVIIARQNLSRSQAEGLIEHFATVLEDNGGRLVDQEYWGVRTMAYKISKNRKGHYAFLRTDAPAPAVQEMERLMRLHEDVMRVLTIKVDAHEELPSATSVKRDLRENRITKH